MSGNAPASRSSLKSGAQAADNRSRPPAEAVFAFLGGAR
jgi:hypothetical protein